MQDKIKEFKQQLRVLDGRKMKWFHENYLPDDITYDYFIYQVNGHGRKIDERIMSAIDKYMKDK